MFDGFIKKALFFYTLMAGVGLLWHYLATGNIAISFTPLRERTNLARELGLIGMAFALNLLFDIGGPKWSKQLKRFQESLQSLLSPLSLGPPQVILLALFSALGEELLFRGALQPSMGIIPATILFALSHFPLKREMWIWPLYALGMGFLLGLLRMWGGDVWSAVLLHFLVNFISLFLIKWV